MNFNISNERITLIYNSFLYRIPQLIQLDAYNNYCLIFNCFNINNVNALFSLIAGETLFRYKNNLILLIIDISILITGLLLFIQPLTTFFGFNQLNLSQLFLCSGIGFLSVVGME